MNNKPKILLTFVLFLLAMTVVVGATTRISDTFTNTTGTSYAQLFVGNMTANNVTIDDIGEMYNSIHVEGALQEIGSALGGTLDGNSTWLLPVKSKDIADPPGTPSVGDRYIVASQSNWYDLNYPYRLELIIDKDYVFTDEAMWAVRVNISGNHDIFSKSLTTSGKDIVFAWDDGIETKHQKLEQGDIEVFNTTVNTTVWYINMSVSSSTNITFYVYYGYEGASEQYTPDASASVWDSSRYELVYHMDVDGLDSTAWGRDRPPLQISYPTERIGAEGLGVHFDGVDQWWSMACNSCYWELEFWNQTHNFVFNTSDDITTFQVLAAEGGTTNGYIAYIENSKVRVGWWSKSTGELGQWMHANIEPNHNNYVLSTVYRCDGSGLVCTGGNHSLYLNGTLYDTNVTTTYIFGHSGNGGIGEEGGTKFCDTNEDGIAEVCSGGFFEGEIHELQVSYEAWSFERHQTYNAMFNTDSFISISSPQTPSGSTGAWSGWENNITQYNASGWNRLPAEDGYTTYILDIGLIYAYDAENDIWQLAGDISSHKNLDDLVGCDPLTNWCGHFLSQANMEAAQRLATDSLSGLLPAGYTTLILEAHGSRILNLDTGSSAIDGEIADNTLYLNFSDSDFVNSTGDIMTGDLNVSANLKTTGNLTVGTDFVIWSNGTVEHGIDTSLFATNYWGVIDTDVGSQAPTGETQLNIYGSGAGEIFVSSDGVATVTIGIDETWVNETGDLMSGDLNISGALSLTENLNVSNKFFVNNTGGVRLILYKDCTLKTASGGNVLCGTDADTIYGGVDDVWVNETGDTMTGNLTMNNNWINGFLTRLGWGNLTGIPGFVSSGDVYVNESGDTMTGNLYITSDGLWINATNCNTVDTDAEGFLYCGTDEGGASADGRMGTNDYWLYNDTSYIMLNMTRINESIDARDSDTIYGGVIDTFVNTTGDNMTSLDGNNTYWFGNNDGNWLGKVVSDIFRGVTGLFDTIRALGTLIVENTLYVYNNNTINMDADLSVASGDVVIWQNGTIESIDTVYGGVADDWVNETGDTMTGDLNINAGLNVTGNLNMTAGNISVETGNLICLTSDCSKYIQFNGTNLIIQG